MIAQIQLLLRLWIRPATAMGEILDRGSLLFASIAAVAVSLGLGLPVPFYTPLFVLAVVYVPGVLLIATLIGRLGGLGTVFQRDYSTLLTCVAMAWTAVMLPLAIASWALPLEAVQLLALAAVAWFATLVFLAVRTVFGTGNGASAGVVVLSIVPLAAGQLLAGPLMMILHLLASPFFLFYVIYYLGAEFRGLGDRMRAGQNYRRMLEAAAINPHDGEAQYQLGLIHQARRQYTEAVRRFQAAVTIDPTETDAHFQLGRIFRDQGRFEEALPHLQAVLAQDEKHSLSEVHRELGAVFLALGRLDEAPAISRSSRTGASTIRRDSTFTGNSSTGSTATPKHKRSTAAPSKRPEPRPATAGRWSRNGAAWRKRPFGSSSSPPHCCIQSTWPRRRPAVTMDCTCQESTFRIPSARRSAPTAILHRASFRATWRRATFAR